MLSAEYANNSPIGGIWDPFPPHQNNGSYIAHCRLVAHFHRGRWRGRGSLSGQSELGSSVLRAALIMRRYAYLNLYMHLRSCSGSPMSLLRRVHPLDAEPQHPATTA